MIQNCLLQKDLQISIATFCYNMYISFFLIQKNTIENRKLNFSIRICEIRIKRKNAKLFALIRYIQKCI